MITLYFIKAWLRWFGGFILAIIGEYAFLRMSWAFVLIGLLTLMLFLLITVLMYGDWRATRRSGLGYRYDIIRDVTRR